jgi:uncharacterized protein
MFKRLVPALLVLLVVACQVAGQGLLTLKVGPAEVAVEIADTPEARRVGLMNRDELGADRGMLFVYSQAHKLKFWMKNTRIPLDIAFIDAAGTILRIAPMVPYDETHTPSGVAVKYALEVNQGWFAKHGVREGMTVKNLPEIK